MASSTHAFMRGSTDRFYHWIQTGKVSKSLPTGPPVWICGDCHTGNLGPVADLRGNIDIQIRDLDQTVIGPPSTGFREPGRLMAMVSQLCASASSTMGRRLYFTYGPLGYLDPAIYYGFQLQFGTSIISISFL